MIRTLPLSPERTAKSRTTTRHRLITGTLLLGLLGATYPGAGQAGTAILAAAPKPAQRSEPGSAGPAAPPDLLPGFLRSDEILDSRVFVPASPGPGSLRQALDDVWAWQMLRLRGGERWHQAARDAVLAFPEAAEVFGCALGFPLTAERTPATYELLRRSLTDLGLSTYPAKNTYERRRPFMQTGTPICTPAEAAKLRQDGSYPSGHTAIGWGWALILAELMPERAEEILLRGRTYGESRNVCNVHWKSDVEAGRMVGAATVARLQAKPDFRAAMEAAQREITAMRPSGPQRSKACTAQRRILLQPLP